MLVAPAQEFVYSGKRYYGFPKNIDRDSLGWYVILDLEAWVAVQIDWR